MRIYVESMAHPKRLAKRAAKLLDIPLHQGQFVVAYVLGYNDWHELEQVTAAQQHPSSRPDWQVSTTVRETRLNHQCDRLIEATNTLSNGLILHDAYGLVVELGASNAMPWKAPAFNNLHQLFPEKWQLSEDDLDGEDAHLWDGYKASVGGSDSIAHEELMNRLLKNVAGAGRLSVQDGYRTLCCCFPGKHKHIDLKEDIPASVSLVFGITPTIVDDVLTGLEIAFPPYSFSSDFLSDDEISLVAETFCAYLSYCSIWSTSEGAVIGALTGIQIRLTGEAFKVGMSRIIRAIEEALESNIERFNSEEGDEFLPPYIVGSYVGDLPILSVVNLCQENISDEDLEAGCLAAASHQFVEFWEDFSGAMTNAPAILGNYLQHQGFAQYAEFTDAMAVESLEDRIKFMGFVRSMERAKAIPESVSLFLRHYFVDISLAPKQMEMMANGDTAFMEEDYDAREDYAKAANELGDQPMGEQYLEKGVDAIMDLSTSGHEIMRPFIKDF